MSYVWNIVSILFLVTFFIASGFNVSVLYGNFIAIATAFLLTYYTTILQDVEKVQQFRRNWTYASVGILVTGLLLMLYTKKSSFMLDLSILLFMAATGWLMVEKFERTMSSIKNTLDEEKLLRHRTICPNFFIYDEDSKMCKNSNAISINSKILEDVEPLFLRAASVDCSEFKDTYADYPWGFYEYVCHNRFIKPKIAIPQRSSETIKITPKKNKDFLEIGEVWCGKKSNKEILVNQGADYDKLINALENFETVQFQNKGKTFLVEKYSVIENFENNQFHSNKAEKLLIKFNKVHNFDNKVTKAKFAISTSSKSSESTKKPPVTHPMFTQSNTTVSSSPTPTPSTQIPNLSKIGVFAVLPTRVLNKGETFSVPIYANSGSTTLASWRFPIYYSSLNLEWVRDDTGPEWISPIVNNFEGVGFWIGTFEDLIQGGEENPKNWKGTNEGDEKISAANLLSMGPSKGPISNFKGSKVLLTKAIFRVKNTTKSKAIIKIGHMPQPPLLTSTESKGANINRQQHSAEIFDYRPGSSEEGEVRISG